MALQRKKQPKAWKRWTFQLHVTKKKKISFTKYEWTIEKGLLLWLSVKCNRKYSAFPHHDYWSRLAQSRWAPVPVTKQSPLCRFLIGPSMQKQKPTTKKKDWGSPQLLPEITITTSSPRTQARSSIKTAVMWQNSQRKKRHASKNNHFMLDAKHSMLVFTSVVNREFSL